MQHPIPILIVEYDKNLLQKIKKRLTGEKRFSLVWTDPSSGIDPLQAAAFHDIRIAVVDIDSGDSTEKLLDFARELRLKTCARLLLISGSRSREQIVSAIRHCFACGYLFRSQIDSIADILRSLLQEQTPHQYIMQELMLAVLTPAERSVLYALLEGSSDLKSSPKTLANQRTSILHKLHLKSTQELLHIFTHY